MLILSLLTQCFGAVGSYSRVHSVIAALPLIKIPKKVNLKMADIQYIPKETKDKLMRPIIDQFAAGNCRYQVNENDFFVIIKNRSIYFYLVFWLT